MSNKMTCPACESTTTDVLDAYHHGRSCPHCSLSATAADEIIDARNRYRESDLLQQLRNAIISNDSLKAQLTEKEAKLVKIKKVLDTDQVPRW